MSQRAKNQAIIKQIIEMSKGISMTGDAENDTVLINYSFKKPSKSELSGEFTHTGMIGGDSFCFEAYLANLCNDFPNVRGSLERVLDFVTAQEAGKS